jgi:hypothetical protein
MKRASPRAVRRSRGPADVARAFRFVARLLPAASASRTTRVVAARFGLFGKPLPSLAAVLLVWCAAVALAGPHGNFPLSDDWAYAHVVRSLCEGRGFDPLPWTGATAVVQVLYGAAACAIGGGFSHEALRWTTLAVSVAGIAAFHLLLLELGAGVQIAAAGAAVLALSPLWFNQSFTFMTDVPFASLALVASWLYVRAFRSGSAGAFLLAGAACAAAFLVRQNAIAIAAAAAAAALWPAGRIGPYRTEPAACDGGSPSIARAAAAIALPLLALAAYLLWAVTAEEVPLAVRNKTAEALSASPLAMAGAGFRALATLGFLFVPWAIATRPAGPASRRAFVAAFALLGAAAAFLFVREGDTMFYLTNVLSDFTVGAVTTRDVLFLGRPLAPTGGAALHGAITLVSLASAAVLVAHLASPAAWSASATRAAAPPRAALFCTLALVLSGLLTLVQSSYYFDRYVLVLLPLAVAAATALVPRVRIGGAAIGAWALLAIYGVAGTHDFMAWNRARWSLLEAAEAGGATARRIDGGVEYNAVRLAAELRTAPTDAEARSGQPASRKSWWWVVDDEWVVAFGALDGYSETDSRIFERWLPPGKGRVLLLRREAGPQAPGAAERQGKERQ